MALFAGFLLATAVLYIGGEFLHWDLAVWDDAEKGTTFITSTLMILLTLTLLPLALRLFKFKRIHANLTEQKAPALLRWGSLRIIIMGVLLIVNTILYYLFAFESTFGYLAVITLLCMPFVVPTMRRCEAEVTEEKPVEENTDQDSEEKTPEGDTIVSSSDTSTIETPSGAAEGTL